MRLGPAEEHFVATVFRFVDWKTGMKSVSRKSQGKNPMEMG